MRDIYVCIYILLPQKWEKNRRYYLVGDLIYPITWHINSYHESHEIEGDQIDVQTMPLHWDNSHCLRDSLSTDLANVLARTQQLDHSCFYDFILIACTTKIGSSKIMPSIVPLKHNYKKIQYQVLVKSKIQEHKELRILVNSIDKKFCYWTRDI